MTQLTSGYHRAPTEAPGLGSPVRDANGAWQSSISAMSPAAGNACASGIRRSPRTFLAEVGGELAESCGNWGAMRTILRGGQAACANVHTSAFVTRGGDKRSFATRHWSRSWLSTITYSFDSPGGFGDSGKEAVWAKSKPGKERCKWHGGRSTGPRTTEGKARARANLRQFRCNQNDLTQPTCKIRKQNPRGKYLHRLP